MRRETLAAGQGNSPHETKDVYDRTFLLVQPFLTSESEYFSIVRMIIGKFLQISSARACSQASQRRRGTTGERSYRMPRPYSISDLP